MFSLIHLFLETFKLCYLRTQGEHCLGPTKTINLITVQVSQADKSIQSEEEESFSPEVTMVAFEAVANK